MKYKIEKNTVQETLILPLYSRKLCTELYPTLYRDETAVRLIDEIDYDFSQAEKNSRSLMQRFGALADSDGQRKNNLRLQEDLKARYYNAPDLSWVGKNGWRFVNAVSDFATHADPIRKTRNYNENLFLRTAEGNPMIDRAYKMVLAAA